MEKLGNAIAVLPDQPAAQAEQADIAREGNEFKADKAGETDELTKDLHGRGLDEALRAKFRRR